MVSFDPFGPGGKIRPHSVSPSAKISIFLIFAILSFFLFVKINLRSQNFNIMGAKSHTQNVQTLSKIGK